MTSLIFTQISTVYGKPYLYFPWWIYKKIFIGNFFSEIYLEHHLLWCYHLWFILVSYLFRCANNTGKLGILPHLHVFQLLYKNPCSLSTCHETQSVPGLTSGKHLHLTKHSSINSLGPSDAKWRQRTESTLAQVMGCCLTAPSHYLNQCRLIISKFLRHPSEGITLRKSEETNQ